MSVQAGIWNFDGKPTDHELVRRLKDSLRCQGPDGGTCYIDGSVALLYHAFHTTAESRKETQPYLSREGSVLTWDGRLDNRDELILELRNDLDADSTDLAIVACAFDRWGTDCFRRIVGDWGLSIWLPRTRQLLLAVDYMAVRHIFYSLTDCELRWSTDLSALVLHSSQKLHINDEYIGGYFAHEPDAHLTPYREICEVPPGQFVRVRSGKWSTGRFWHFEPKQSIRYKSDSEYEEHFRQLFRQSVVRRLRSDSPILAELSGGLDSSSIVCMADDILAREHAQAPRLDTLSYFDPSEPGADDVQFFPKIEQKRARIGAHIDLSALGNHPCSFQYSHFVPLPGYTGAGRALEDQRAEIMQRGGYKTVLSGIGGDEFMGGIPDPHPHLADLLLTVDLVKFAKELAAWSMIKRKPWIQLLLAALTNLLPTRLSQHLVKKARPETWIEPTFARRTKIPIRLLGPSITGCRVWRPSQRSYVRGLLLMAAKMAKLDSPVHALEDVRYPYLDRDLLMFILAIPADQLLRPGDRRSLMRRSLVNYVPSEVLGRRTKQTGARTHICTIEKNWTELQCLFDSPLTAQLGYLNPERFLTSLHGLRHGTMVHISRLQRAISLELWTRDLASRRIIDNMATTTPFAGFGQLVPDDKLFTDASTR